MNKNISIAIAVLLVLGIGVYAYMNSNSEEENNTNSIVCSQEYVPVCGVDGMTYSNACIATTQNEVEIAYEGECMLEDQEEDTMPMPEDLMPEMPEVGEVEGEVEGGVEGEVESEENEMPEDLMPEMPEDEMLEVELE